MKQLKSSSVKLILVLFLSLSLSETQAQWNQVYQSDSIYFTSVFFVNDSTGFACGLYNAPRAIILKTIDYGASWDTVFIGLGFPFDTDPVNAIFFPSEQIGYIVGGGSQILKTIDGGQNWQVINIGNYYATFIYCINDTTCFMGDTNAGLPWFLKTTNGGYSWEQDTTLAGAKDVYFSDANIGYALWSKTTDGGNTWSTPVFPQSLYASYNCIFFINDSIGWAGGLGQNGSPNFNFGTIAKTIDGGQTWIQKDFQYEMLFINDIVFVNKDTGWACGSGQSFNSRQVMKTVDGGQTWYKQFLNYTGGYSGFNQMSLRNDSLIYAVSSHQIFKTTNGGGPLIGVGINENTATTSFPLVIPNPANQTISLINIQPNTLITITNITANTVLQTTLNQTNQINISHLSNGLYFIQTQSKNNIQTTKFIKQ